MTSSNVNVLRIIEIVVLIFLQFVKSRHIAKTNTHTYDTSEHTAKKIQNKNNKGIYCQKKLSVFAQTFYVAFVAYSNLQTNMIYSTERDLYYRQPWLFQHSGKQRGVHNAINRLCMWLHNARDVVMKKSSKNANSNNLVLSLVSIHKFFFQPITFTSNNCDGNISVTDNKQNVTKETTYETSSNFTLCKDKSMRKCDGQNKLSSEKIHKGVLCTKFRRPFTPLFTREMLRLSSSPKATIVGNLIFDVQDNSSNKKCTCNGSELKHSISCAGEGVLLTMAIAESACHFRWVNEFYNISEPCKQTVQTKNVADKSKLLSTAAMTRAALTNTEFKSRTALVLVEKECILQELVHKYNCKNDKVMEATNVTYGSRVNAKSTSSFDVSRSFKYTFMCCRGYPCIASRIFLKRIHKEWPDLPLLALVDGDVHGINILLTYMGLRGQRIAERSNVKEEINPLPINGKETINKPSETRLEIDYLSHLLPIEYVGLTPSQLASYQQRHDIITEQKKNNGFTNLNSDVNLESKSNNYLIPLSEHDAILLLTLLTLVSSAIHDVNVMFSFCLLAIQNTNKTIITTTTMMPLIENVINTAYHRNKQVNDLTIITKTLHRVKRELEWMQKTQLKCELESINAETLLRLVDEHNIDVNNEHESNKRSRGM